MNSEMAFKSRNSPMINFFSFYTMSFCFVIHDSVAEAFFVWLNYSHNPENIWTIKSRFTPNFNRGIFLNISN